MNRWIGNVAVFVVGLVIGLLVGGLLVASAWRTMQFGEWLGVGLPGSLALTAGQLALLVVPGVLCYFEFSADTDRPTISWLFGLVCTNLAAGFASALLQFKPVFQAPAGWDAQLASAVAHAVLPGCAALGIAAVAWMFGRHAAGHLPGWAS